MNSNLGSVPNALASSIIGVLNLQSALADDQVAVATAVGLQPTTQAGVLSHREACQPRDQSSEVWAGNS